MKTSLKIILKLMEKKYPTNYSKGMNPVLVIYDDESGRIVKDALCSMYKSGNTLFAFSSIEELMEHLKS